MRTGTSSKDDCQDVDCPEGICEHGGLCVAVHHRPKCFCPAGFTGARCEINVDECASAPCYNGGTCVDLPQGYRYVMIETFFYLVDTLIFYFFRCDCTEGFDGKQCDEEQSDCKDNPCPNRAMCRDEPGPGNYTCLCKSGYTGESCDITVDPCQSGPCSNGAICESYQQVLFLKILILNFSECLYLWVLRVDLDVSVLMAGKDLSVSRTLMTVKRNLVSWELPVLT